MNKYIIVILLLIIIQRVSLATTLNDYSLDISPLIEKDTAFSVGLEGVLNEYNAWFRDDKLYTLYPYNENINKRDTIFRFAPYFTIRPLRFIEVKTATSFIYQLEEYRNDITRATNKNDGFSFDSISVDAKVNLLDWYLAIAVKTGFNYSFKKDVIQYNTITNETVPFNFYTTIMLAGIPKVIPINFIFNYKFDTRTNPQDILKYGEIIGALEFITSPFINLYTGVSYVFPYNPQVDDMTYLEPFVKFKAEVGNFLTMTTSFKKIVLGSGNAPNTATFTFSIEYNFYTPSWEFWSFKIAPKTNNQDNNNN